MVRLGQNAKTEKQRYSVIREDKDNDGDGKRGEDSERGIDLNRNYPEGWWNDSMPGGTGTYPTSSPEVHAQAEFFMNHTNIGYGSKRCCSIGLDHGKKIPGDYWRGRTGSLEISRKNSCS